MNKTRNRFQLTQQFIDAYHSPKEILAFDEAEQRWIAVEHPSRRLRFNPELLKLLVMYAAIGFLVGLLLGAWWLK